MTTFEVKIESLLWRKEHECLSDERIRWYSRRVLLTSYCIRKCIPKIRAYSCIRLERFGHDQNYRGEIEVANIERQSNGIEATI